MAISFHMISASRLVNLLDRLQDAGLDYQPEELADIIWLAAQLPKDPQVQSAQNEVTRSATDIESEMVIETNELIDDTVDEFFVPGGADAIADLLSSRKDLAVDQQAKAALTAGTGQATQNSLPYRIGMPEALPYKLAYSRALRPLTRRIPSLYDHELDEDATIQRIVDEEVWMPVMRPAMTRWLELDVIVDEWPSMEISYYVVEEFLKILDTLGAFSSIQVWGMSTELDWQEHGDNSSRVRLHPGFGRDSDVSRQDRHPKELIGDVGRGLVLVISDCVSPGWYNGLIGKLLETWGQQNMVMLLQTLPEELWERTGLINSITLQLRYPSAGSNNQRLDPFFEQKLERWVEKIQKDSLKENKVPSFFYLPVTSLSPESLGRWAQALSGNSLLHIRGRWLPTDNARERRREKINYDLGRISVSEMSARERLQRFLSIASPMARRLAGFMAAIPLSLPVMHLVQRAVLPESMPEHMAEFFLGGIVDRRPDTQMSNSKGKAQIQYDFWKDDSGFDIRAELLRQLRMDERQQVWLPVAGYIQQNFSTGGDFEAIVTDPAFAHPFALVGLEGLRSQGGKYAALADQIQKQEQQSTIVNPTIGQTQKGKAKMYKLADKTCFVLMPFGQKQTSDGTLMDFDSFYDVIRDAVEGLGMECNRADEIIQTGSIHEKLFDGILKADIAVVDITLANPNIFYELGLRHALKRNVTVVIRQSGSQIPWNIQGLSVLEYAPDDYEQLRMFSERLSKLIQRGLESQIVDSPVYEIFSNLRVELAPRVIERREEKLYQILNLPGKQIGYITGNINNVKSVDIWVNSENTNMQMARHYERSISATIRYGGARKDRTGMVTDDLIANELQDATRGRNITPGSVIITTAGELEKSNGVKRIFHAAAVVGQPGRGYIPVNNLSDCVRNVLQKADSKELADIDLQSILFPLIGTATALRSAQEVADELIDEVIAYFEENPASVINRVYFLAYNEQDLEICTHKFINDPRIVVSFDADSQTEA